MNRKGAFRWNVERVKEANLMRNSSNRGIMSSIDYVIKLCNETIDSYYVITL